MDELYVKSHRLNIYFKIRSIERDENYTKILQKEKIHEPILRFWFEYK